MFNPYQTYPTQMQLASEASTVLGAGSSSLGPRALDRALTLKALGGGLAGSKCLEQKTPNYVAGTYNPGFKIDLHFKDLGLIMESSRALGVPLPCTAVVQELFNAMRVKGKGGLEQVSAVGGQQEQQVGVGRRAVHRVEQVEQDRAGRRPKRALLRDQVDVLEHHDGGQQGTRQIRHRPDGDQ